MRNVAIVLAGGTGSRVGGPVPKQFLPLDGREVIEHSVDTFCAHPAIAEVAVVVHPDWQAHVRDLQRRNGWEKLKKVIVGGAERWQSSLAAIRAYAPAASAGEVNLLLHDAARPFVTAEVVDRVVSALQHCEAVGTAVPSTDTVWEVGSGERKVESGEWKVESGKWKAENSSLLTPHSSLPTPFIASIPDRRQMWRAQTPQAFRLGLIAEAYRRAMQDPAFAATDDCSVVHRYCPDVPIAVVEGSEANLKITFADDMASASLKQPASGHPGEQTTH